jgi:hypothetical protein
VRRPIVTSYFKLAFLSCSLFVTCFFSFAQFFISPSFLISPALISSLALLGLMLVRLQALLGFWSHSFVRQHPWHTAPVLKTNIDLSLPVSLAFGLI